MLWTGNGAYLVEFSEEGKMGQSSRMLWAAMESAIFSGGLFLLFALDKEYNLPNISHSFDRKIESSYLAIYSILSVISLVAVILMALLPRKPAPRKDVERWFFLLETSMVSY